MHWESYSVSESGKKQYLLHAGCHFTIPIIVSSFVLTYAFVVFPPHINSSKSTYFDSIIYSPSPLGWGFTYSGFLHRHSIPLFFRWQSSETLFQYSCPKYLSIDLTANGCPQFIHSFSLIFTQSSLHLGVPQASQVLLLQF